MKKTLWGIKSIKSINTHCFCSAFRLTWMHFDAKRPASEAASTSTIWTKRVPQSSYSPHCFASAVPTSAPGITACASCLTTTTQLAENVQPCSLTAVLNYLTTSTLVQPEEHGHPACCSPTRVSPSKQRRTQSPSSKTCHGEQG